MNSSFKKLKPQPIHEKMDNIRTVFVSKRIGDPMTEDGFKSIISNESYDDLFFKQCGEVISDENVREVYGTQLKNSINVVRNPFYELSSESADMLPTANYNQLARLIPWSILGYMARSKAIEAFYNVSSDKPSIFYEYNIPFVTKGDKKFILPNAIRNGELTGQLNLPEATPIVSPSSPHIEAGANYATDPSDVWIKIGSQGNLLLESGFAVEKAALQRNIYIKSIKYTIPGSLTGGDPVSGELDIYLNRETTTGDIARRVFHENINIAFTKADNSQATVTTFITGFINLDSGEYAIATSDEKIITHFRFGDARVTNLANEFETMRPGNNKYIHSFDTNDRAYMTIPITPETADDFNAAGDGVTLVAYMTDRLTEAYAGVRDADMETALDEAYNKNTKDFPLAVKLGGYKRDVPFVLSARGPGGDNPFTWIREGLRDTVRHVFTEAETEGYFETGIDRQWILIGHKIDINRFPDISYTTIQGGMESAENSTVKYGFAVEGFDGYVDSLGGRVKVVGSVYKRHYKKPVRAILKSYSIEQPTSIYFPYAFRVYSGISPEYGKRPAIIVSARDYIGLLSSFQARISLFGNDIDLYKKASAFSAGRPDAITFD